MPGSETATAYARATPGGLLPNGQWLKGHPGTLIVQLNGAGGNAWAYSTNGGKNWNACDVTFCGPGGTRVPFAPSTGNWLLGRYTQNSWNGDPGIAASIDGNTVVMSNMAHAIHPAGVGLPDAVVVSSSIDGGRTFIQTEFANTTNCVGQEDQPSIAADAVVPNRYWTVWRHRGDSFQWYGACVRGFDVDIATGAFTFINDPKPFSTPGVYSLAGIGGLIVQARGAQITVMYADNDLSAFYRCSGDVTIGWNTITSLDWGVTWTRYAPIDKISPEPTCLPDATDGAIQTGIRNFAFVRDYAGTMWAAVPAAEGRGFKIFASTDTGISWQFFQQVGGNVQTFFPTLAADDHGRVGLSFQQAASGLAGQPLVASSTWFAAKPWGAGAFVGPTPISGGYFPVNPPPQGSCSHSLCSTGAGLSPGCDPTGCVQKVVQKNILCALAWSRGCADAVGTCGGGYHCNTRSLGDYAGATSIPTGDIPGVNATFLPAWTQTVGGESQVTAALVQVTP